jgi:hypothetical protein
MWKKITRGIPRGRKYADDRIPSNEELKKLLEYPDRRIKPIVYTMISSGGRLGMWDYLRWSHIVPVSRNGKVVAAKIRIYAGEPEEYSSFISRSALNELEKWMEYRRTASEEITGDSWVLRDLWDTTARGKGLASHPRKLSSSGVKRLIERALWAQGLRTTLQENKKRHPYQAIHSMRKVFKTRCELAGMKPLIIEELLSHSTGINDSYFRPTEDELLQAYIDIEPTLSIEDSGENNLRQSISEELADRDDSIAALADKVAKLTEEIQILKKERH